jgi:adenylate cyclase
VRVREGLGHCPPARDEERRTLERIRAPHDVRLACQLRPTGNLAVEPVLAVERPRWQAPPALPKVVEREATLLALDVELDTQLSAHDRFYALERCRALAEGLFDGSGAVEIQTQIGRWCGVYGLEGTAAAGARRALAAAERLVVQAEALVSRLSADLGAGARAAVVVHAGSVVVGRVGAAESTRHAALGEAVDALDALLHDARACVPPIVRTARVRALADDAPQPPSAAAQAASALGTGAGDRVP